jgi:hypothetical protein
VSDFFDRLERELKGAVVRAAASAPGSEAPEAARRRRARRTVNGLLITVGSVAAIAVVVIAIAVTGHDRHGQGRHGQAASVGHSAEFACTRQLFAQLAVLRRPQTAADRTFDPQTVAGPVPGESHPSSSPLRQSSPSSTSFPGAIEPDLTRLARTLPNGRRVFFVVYKQQSGGFPASGQAITTVQVFVVGDQPTSAVSPENFFPDLVSNLYRDPPTEVAKVYYSVVPDGVARVEWTFPHETIPAVKEPGGHVLPGRVFPRTELTASVQGNVAAAEAPRHPVFAPPYVTWLAADGHVIKSYQYKVPNFAHLPKSKTVTETLTAVGAPVPSGSC